MAAQEGGMSKPAPETLKSLIEGFAYRHDKWQVWQDFTAMAAISISNAVDFAQREAREAEYMRIVKRYTAEEVAAFPKMTAAIAAARGQA
jgi:hypothetical protein